MTTELRLKKPPAYRAYIFERLLSYVFNQTNNFIMVLIETSEDVCWSIRNVKFINESFYNMRCLVMFITAICVLFLLKLKWPKNKSIYLVQF